MFILWGTKVFRRLQGAAKAENHCNSCGMYTVWELYNLWTWFTLFFIPLFPIYKKTVFICPRCGNGVKVDKNNREEIMKLINP